MTNDREAGIRQQLKTIGAERELLMRQFEGVRGRIRTRDSGRGYDTPSPTTHQKRQMLELATKIAQCDEAIKALTSLS